MEKKELITEAKQKREDILKQIEELEQQSYDLMQDIERLSAPEIPVEKIGKFLKHEDKNHTSVIRVDNITSYSDGYDSEDDFIQYHGYGASRVKRGSQEIIRICNNLSITDYINHKNNNVSEITLAEFISFMNDASDAVVNKLDADND